MPVCYEDEMENTRLYKNLHTNVYSSIIHTVIAKKWKQPKYQSTDEPRNKMQPVDAMEYYVARKKGCCYMLSMEDLESTVLAKEAQFCTVPFIQMSVIGKSIQKES